MSKVKKVLATVIAASVAASMAVGATGCQKVDTASSTGGAGNTGSATASGASTGNISGELKLAVFKGGYGDQVWKDIAAKFEEKYPNVKVSITADPNLGDVIRPKIINNDAPDLIYLASTNKSGLMQSLISDKQLVDVSDVFEDGLKDKLIDGVLDGPTYQPYGDGKIYAAPLFYSVNGIWYDANLFEKNDWSVPKTWDEAFALADKAKEKGIAMYTYAAANAPAYNENVVWPMIAAIGGEQKLDDIFNYKAGAWNDQAVTDTLNIFKKMADGGYLLDGTMGMNHTQSQQQWMQDKALFIPNGAWIQNEMKDSPRADGFKFAMMPTPATKEGQKQAIWSQTEEMYIPTKAKNIDAAKAFMKFLYEDDVVKMMAKASNSLPPLKNGPELVKGLVDDATYSSMQIGASSDYIQVSGGFANTQSTNINIRQDFFKGIGDILSKKTTPADLQKKLEDESQQLAKLVTTTTSSNASASSN